MYYQNYEGYMKNDMGMNYMPSYMNNTRPNYQYNYYPTYQNMMRQEQFNDNKQTDVQQIQKNEERKENCDILKIRKMYPEIYNILDPMIEKSLKENNKEINENILEIMTNNIYNAVEEDMKAKSVMQNRQVIDNKNRNIISTQVSNNLNKNIGNPTLKDLIKILILNKIINKNCNSTCNMQQRPPMYPRPMPRMDYPFMNYFTMPYPEDEYYG